MSWFWDAIARVSRSKPGDLEAHARTLPVHFLDLARSMNPQLASRTEALERTRAQLLAAVGAGIHRDPELYFPIFSLIDRAPDLARADELLARLDWTLGTVDLRRVPRLADGYYRLRRPEPTLYRARDGALRRLDEPLRVEVEGLAAEVWLPHDELFHDILDPEIYPRLRAPIDRGWLLARLAGAVRLLRAHAVGLADDFDRAVTTIVLLPDWPEESIPEGELRWSFNLRFRYFGGIFLNLFRTDEHGIAEGLLHEYCHQRMWQWWELERPSGIPPVEDHTESPLTGARKPTCVMIHALLIYGAAADFYRRSLAAGDAGSEFAVRRLARLEASIPALHRRLCEKVPRGTGVRTLLDEVLDRHTAGPAPRF